MKLLRFRDIQLENYGHTFKSARSLINSAFETLPTDEIVFNEVGDKLHVIIYASAIEIDELEVALASLQSEEILGKSIEVDEVVGHAYVKLIVDEKLLEHGRTLV